MRRQIGHQHHQTSTHIPFPNPNPTQLSKRQMHNFFPPLPLLSITFFCAICATFELNVGVKVSLGGNKGGGQMNGAGGRWPAPRANPRDGDPSAPFNNGSAIVRTQNGLVNGTQGTYFPNITVWKGIPFAAAPVGDLRWRAPQPAQNWSGVRQGDTFGAVCPQYSYPVTVNSALMGAEDCLFLNVWSGAIGQNSSRPRPVYVWIFGGRFTGGYGSDPQFDGEGLAAKGLVVVTLNYRVGPLGFMALPQLRQENAYNGSGNYGLMDQIAALKWVQANIAAFGGDPAKVTIGGESAGGGSCYMLALSPAARGLFRAAVPESGGVFWPHDPEHAGLPSSHYTLEKGEQNSLAYVANITGNANTSLEALRNLTLAQVMSTDEALGTDNLDPEWTWNGAGPVFHPVTDGYVIPMNYEQIMEQGIQNNVAMMTGNNHDEWGAWGTSTLAEYEADVAAKYGNMSAEFLAIYPALNDSDAGAVRNGAIRDNTRTTTFLWSQLWMKHNKQPFYYYLFTHVPSTSSIGVYHGADIAFFLDNLYANMPNATAADIAVADTVSSYLVNFVSHLNPNGPGLPQWPRANGRDQLVMEVGNNYSLVPILEGNATAKMDFLKRFYASQRQW